MTFELLPTIDIMLGLYRKPRNRERFDQYLRILKGGSKGDLVMPVSGFNPMAKEHVPAKLMELKQLDAEGIVENALHELNKKLAGNHDTIAVKVALNLSDDAQGGWTNRFTADFDSKFKPGALVTRRFCTPVFWSGELFTPAMIKQRTLQYCYRTVYWLNHSTLRTLEDHIEQERFVAGKTNDHVYDQAIGYTFLDTFYQQHKHTADYSLIFNFLYGDHASASLGFPCYGITGNMPGFEFAKNTGFSTIRIENYEAD